MEHPLYLVLRDERKRKSQKKHIKTGQKLRRTGSVGVMKDEDIQESAQMLERFENHKNLKRLLMLLTKMLVVFFVCFLSYRNLEERNWLRILSANGVMGEGREYVKV